MTQPERIGRYVIKRELGRGGMATVYLGHDPRFRRDVAVKVLPRQFTHDPMFRARFEREAQTIAALEHPAIVPVYDFGEDDGQPYLVMRYMPGGSLGERLEQGPIPLLETANILKRIAAALDLAHGQGVIHRDLKPGNILFDQYGEAFLADFGIAKMAEATAALTGSAIIGTPAYMSPEQVKGQKIDGRSDIYTLGVILFEMLTGQQPFAADTPIAVAFKHVNDPVPDIRTRKSDLNAGLQSAIDRAMAKEANGRYQTAGDLAGNVSAITGGKGITQKEQPPPMPTEPEIAPLEVESIGQTEVVPFPDDDLSPIDGSSRMEAPPPSEPYRDEPKYRPPATAARAAPAYAEPARERGFPVWLWAVIGLVAVAGVAIGALTLLRDGETGGDGTAVAGGAGETESENMIVVDTPTNTPTLPPSPSATVTPQPTDTPPPTSTATVMPTDTPVPTATEPPTLPPCPEPELRIALSSVNVRSGPGSRYAVLDIALQDDVIPIIARTESSSWYNVEFEGQRGWISATVVELLADDECVEIPVAATIPAPPPPTATATAIPTNTPVPGSPPGGGDGGGNGGGPPPPTPTPTPARLPTATPANPP